MNVDVALDGLGKRAKNVKFYQDVFMERVKSHWNVNAYRAGLDYYVKRLFVLNHVIKTMATAGDPMNVGVALVGLVKIAPNVSHIPDARMVLAIVHGNVIVKKVGVVCCVIMN